MFLSAYLACLLDRYYLGHYRILGPARTSFSEGAEAGLFQAYFRAGGLAAAGAHAYLGRGRLRIRRRRLGGKSAGGAGSGRLYRIS